MRLTDKHIGFLKVLIDTLEKTFPDSIPINSSPSIEDFRRLQGHQEVIQYIRNMKDEQDPEGDDEDAD